MKKKEETGVVNSELSHDDSEEDDYNEDQVIESHDMYVVMLTKSKHKNLRWVSQDLSPPFQPMVLWVRSEGPPKKI